MDGKNYPVHGRGCSDDNHSARISPLFDGHALRVFASRLRVPHQAPFCPRFRYAVQLGTSFG